MANRGSGGRGPNENKPPKDVKDLLELCIGAQGENQDEEEDPVPVQPMSAERRQWLNNALVDLTVSPVEKMKECLRTLTSPNVTEKKMTEALEEVIEWCENLDFAADFYKIGGYPVLKELMKHKTADIRWNTLELVAVLVQNHPFCQEMALKENLLTQMLNTLDTDDNATVKTKALYAVSCLTRENQKAQKVFADHDGFSVLMRAMQTDVEKLKIKAAFLLSSLCSNQPEFKDVMCDTGMIDQLVGVLGEEHSPFHEHTLSALLSIVSHHQRAIEECQRPELDLSEILQRRIKFLEGKDEFNEESYYAKELLKLISADDIEVQR